MQPMPSHSVPGVHTGKLAGRRARNASLRAIGEEPPPGRDGGIKRWMRFHKRALLSPLKIGPDRELLFLHAAERQRRRDEQWGTKDALWRASTGQDLLWVDRDCVLLDGTCDCPTRPDRTIPECQRHA